MLTAIKKIKWHIMSEEKAQSNAEEENEISAIFQKKIYLSMAAALAAKKRKLSVRERGRNTYLSKYNMKID
jgi:hypothetical protein